MAHILKVGVTDKEAVDAAFTLKSYAKEHTFKDSIFPKIDQQAFYNMVVPSPYRVSPEDKKLLEGLSAAGATIIRVNKNKTISWVKIENHCEVVYDLPSTVLDCINAAPGDYDIIELITGELQIR